MKYVILMEDDRDGELYEIDTAASVAEAGRMVKNTYQPALPDTKFFIKFSLSLDLYREGEY